MVESFTIQRSSVELPPEFAEAWPDFTETCPSCAATEGLRPTYGHQAGDRARTEYRHAGCGAHWWVNWVRTDGEWAAAK